MITIASIIGKMKSIPHDCNIQFSSIKWDVTAMNPFPWLLEVHKSAFKAILIRALSDNTRIKNINIYQY